MSATIRLILTATERRVLGLIAADLSTKEIAAQLSVSPRTVETHRQNIGSKLNVHGSLALVRFALQQRTDLRPAAGDDPRCQKTVVLEWVCRHAHCR